MPLWTVSKDSDSLWDAPRAPVCPEGGQVFLAAESRRSIADNRVERRQKRLGEYNRSRLPGRVLLRRGTRDRRREPGLSLAPRTRASGGALVEASPRTAMQGRARREHGGLGRLQAHRRRRQSTAAFSTIRRPGGAAPASRSGRSAWDELLLAGCGSPTQTRRRWATCGCRRSVRRRRRPTPRLGSRS